MTADGKPLVEVLADYPDAGPLPCLQPDPGPSLTCQHCNAVYVARGPVHYCIEGALLGLQARNEELLQSVVYWKTRAGNAAAPTDDGEAVRLLRELYTVATVKDARTMSPRLRTMLLKTVGDYLQGQQ